MGKKRILLEKYLSLARSALYRKRWINLMGVVFSWASLRKSPFGLPFLVHIEPSNRCNLKCRLCVTGRGILERPNGDMRLALFKEIIDQLEGGIIYLVLYNMGEPLLNPDIFEMIKYAKKKKIFIKLSTHGQFEDKACIKNLIDSGLDELVISLDHADAKTYRDMKGNNGFEMVLENTRLLLKERDKRLKPFIILQLLATRDNEKNFSQFKEMAGSLDVDRGFIKEVCVNFPGSKPETDFLPVNKKYIRKAYAYNFRRRHLCYRPWISSVVFWDGSIVSCCFDQQGNHVLGNIQNESFRKIWDGKNSVAFRNKMIDGIHNVRLCSECSLGDLFYDFELVR